MSSTREPRMTSRYSCFSLGDEIQANLTNTGGQIVQVRGKLVRIMLSLDQAHFWIKTAGGITYYALATSCTAVKTDQQQARG